MKEWIKTEEQLPPERKYVIGRFHARNWIDQDDQENVGVIIVKLIKGLSLKEREQLSDTNIRKIIYEFGDENDINLVPYRWTTFDGTTFLGQDIIEWKFID